MSNLPRSDLPLRPELGPAAALAGLRPADLITLSDLPGPASLPPERTRWVLVDHNKPTGELAERFFAGGGGTVVGCIDHHEDESVVPRDAEPRVISRCGSCASLVVDYAQSAGWWTGSASGEGEAEIDAQLAHIALAPTLVDTGNLGAADRTTATDVASVAFTEGLIARAGGRGIGGEDGTYDRRAYFERLTQLKEDVAGMSYRDVFRKDYKQWRESGLTLGMSGTVPLLAEVLEKVGDEKRLLADLRSWADERGLDIVGVMTARTRDGVFTRELLLWALNGKSVEVAKKFAEKNAEALGLRAWEGGRLDDVGTDGEWRRCWRQDKVQNSRKQVAPMIREVMREESARL